MRSAILAVVAVLATAALAAPAAAKKMPVPPALPADLGVFGPGGLQVGPTVLYDKPVDGAAYDAAQDLIWIVSQRQLFVIDLRDEHPTVVVIAKNLPDDRHEFGITGWSGAKFETDYASVYPQLELGAKKATVSADIGAYAGMDEAGDKQATKAIKKIKIVGNKWIAAHASRAPHAVPATRDDPPNVALPPGMGVCEEADLCGTASWLADSPYQSVLVTHDCGDACHTACVLYDPKAKKYAPAAAGGTWGSLEAGTAKMQCIGFQVEPGGAHYFGQDGDGANMVCTLGAGPMTCADAAPWVPFAWVKK